MVGDNERREVAARLRNVEMHTIPDARIADNPMTVEFIAAAVFYDLPYVRGLFSRLADLIEPSCDRAVLLALADELEENACWEVQSPGVDNCAWRIKDVCDRIRESLGVQDGN